MRKEIFVTGEYYHIFNRGVDSSQIFHSIKDYQRFYESLFLFNDENYIHIKGDRIEDEVNMATTAMFGDHRIPKVSLLAFCLLPNHFHLFLRQETENGISSFMQQVAKGYAQYINIKYGRTGPLFNGRFRAVHVLEEAHYCHLPRYIHLNALDLINIDWRNGQIQDFDSSIKFLDTYPWSSHNMYCGKDQLLPIIQEQDIRDLFISKDEYLKFLSEWSGRWVIDRDKDKDLRTRL